MSGVLILIPAAGASSRMRGPDKLIEAVDGKPLLARQVERALATGCEVLVTVSQDHPARAEVLSGLESARLQIMRIDGREGMAVSLRNGAGAAERQNAVAMMVLLADMPDLDTPDLAKVIAAQRNAPDQVHRAVTDTGQPGHPVVFPRRMFDRLEKVTGDAGAHNLLRGENVQLTTLPGQRAVTDLDTPEDWAAWQKLRG
jgi:CTP:molybdopterin cytidylyltransferase MocA